MNKGVKIKILDMPILDSANSNANNGMEKLVTNIVLELLSYLADTERKKLLVRQKEGIMMAKLNGVKLGRPCAIMPDNFEVEYKRLQEKKEITAVECMRKLNLAKTTFYRMVSQYESQVINTAEK